MIWRFEVKQRFGSGRGSRRRLPWFLIVVCERALKSATIRYGVFTQVWHWAPLSPLALFLTLVTALTGQRLFWV